jgi:hypothetical protein
VFAVDHHPLAERLRQDRLSRRRWRWAVRDELAERTRGAAVCVDERRRLQRWADLGLRNRNDRARHNPDDRSRRARRLRADADVIQALVGGIHGQCRRRRLRSLSRRRGGRDDGRDQLHVFGPGLRDDVHRGRRRVRRRANVSAQSTTTGSTSACPDTTPPTTPTGLVQTGATPTSVSLAWNASTDNVGVAGYGVYLNGTTPNPTYASPDSGFSWPRGGQAALTLDARDVPLVVFVSDGNGQVNYTNKVSGSWSLPVTIFSGTNEMRPSLTTALDGDAPRRLDRQRPLDEPGHQVRALCERRLEQRHARRYRAGPLRSRITPAQQTPTPTAERHSDAPAPFI